MVVYFLILIEAFGSAISDIAEAMAQCTIGKVVVSGSVWKLIKVFFGELFFFFFG
jgi:hypothetical protein